MKLFLDTSNNLQTVVRLDGQEFVTTYDSPRDQDILTALTKALETIQKTVKDISEIEINLGPGSFTGLRVGVSIANALSFALKIPINGQTPGTIIIPEYGKPPSITISKKNPPQN